ncbi:MAG: glycoside hydrolase family 57 protein [Pseudomonadota bacterium]
MSDNQRLKVVLAWHMHQPQYQDLLSGEFRLPWTYLHATKDYVDMAAHLEAVPQARAVVNFAPILLEQFAEYSAQIERFQRDGTLIQDPLLAALASPSMPAGPASRTMLVSACRRSHDQRMIERFPPYLQICELAARVDEQPFNIAYLNDEFLIDLLVWYHLAWIGETVRRSDPRVRRLMDRERGYSLSDRHELLGLIGGLIASIVPRYRALAERGQVELSVTPYAHPILPLILDFASAREAMPETTLPPAMYPGGLDRARWHIRRGVEVFEKYFGFRPAGCWPAEGSVCQTSLSLFAEAGVEWVATGQGVLSHSLHAAGHAPHAMKEAWLYRPYRTSGGPACFFRDDDLSDRIGFRYATWHTDDAVADFVHALEQSAGCCQDHPDRVVSIVLDGENAWEHYPENGYYFLSALYRKLADHPRLELTTFHDALATSPTQDLTHLVAGSWVHGNFSTWIGDPQKNHGWELLVEAKQAFDGAAIAADARALAEKQLAICEGSDWFWWFGDYNPAATVSDFDALYRLHLANLYRILGIAVPATLTRAFAHGHGTPAHGGTMRPGSASN